MLALPPLPSRKTLAGRTVALHHHMHGRLAVVYQDQVWGLLPPVQLGPPRLEQFVPAPQHLATKPAAPPPSRKKRTAPPPPNKHASMPSLPPTTLAPRL